MLNDIIPSKITPVLLFEENPQVVAYLAQPHCTITQQTSRYLTYAIMAIVLPPKGDTIY